MSPQNMNVGVQDIPRQNRLLVYIDHWGLLALGKQQCRERLSLNPLICL